MPLYTLHLYPWNRGTADKSIKESFHRALYEQITELHSKTFSCDPASVRVECVVPWAEEYPHDYGGYGYQPVSQGKRGFPKLSDYIVVNMDFVGSGEEWQAYCRKLVWIPGFKGTSVGSVYLQRNVYEFEVRDTKTPGAVTGLGTEELPSYEA